MVVQKLHIWITFGLLLEIEKRKWELRVLGCLYMKKTSSIHLNIHETYMHGKYCINIETDSTPICSKVISQWKKRKKYTSNVALWKLVRWNYGYDSRIIRFLFNWQMMNSHDKKDMSTYSVKSLLSILCSQFS